MSSDLRFIAALRDIRERLQDHTRRIAGSEMRGKVAQVDPERARVRVVIGKTNDGSDVLSPWVPYKQTAGALRFHNPPSVGQVMAVRSETGDIEQGLAEPFSWSDDNPDISSAGDVHAFEFGAVKVEVSEDGISLRAGETALRVTEAGIEITAAKSKMSGGPLTIDADLDVRGSALTHNGRNIGDTHTHAGVQRGGGRTDPPG